MEKGYFFSLEALIAAMILMTSIVFISSSVSPHSDKEAKIYGALDSLQEGGVLSGMSDGALKESLEKTLGFVIEVNPAQTNGSFIKYFIVEGSNKFRIIQVAYQQP
jgi:hypothetical protein